MGLLDGFERLINEHGSAVILRERIALAEDKYSALEKKNADLETENVSLKSQIQILKTENDRLKSNNSELNVKIKNLSKAPDSHSASSLDEPKVKILSLLAKLSDEVDADYIASQCNLSLQAAKFHLQELEDEDMIGASYYTDGNTTWYLDQEGRRYLIQRGLL